MKLSSVKLQKHRLIYIFSKPRRFLVVCYSVIDNGMKLDRNKGVFAKQESTICGIALGTG